MPMQAEPVGTLVVTVGVAPLEMFGTLVGRHNFGATLADSVVASHLEVA